VFIEGVGRVDVLVGDRLVLELDGYGFHATGESFETDRRRDLALAARGYRVIRLSYRQVMFEWNEAERVILSMVRRGEHVRPRRR
jgi:very-short-patch-repair endonuclease